MVWYIRVWLCCLQNWYMVNHMSMKFVNLIICSTQKIFNSWYKTTLFCSCFISFIFGKGRLKGLIMNAGRRGKQMEVIMIINGRSASSQVSDTIGSRQMLADNRGWRMIKRESESIAVELRKSVDPTVWMVDSESDGSRSG